LRLIGIDTPETVAPGEPVACFGPEASDRTKALATGQTVTLEKDVSETDQFDRLLRYVYLPDGRMLNEVLVSEGYARAVEYPPDVKYAQRFEAEGAAAREAGLGLWGAGCPEVDAAPTPTPTVYVAPASGECPEGCSEPPSGCLIKGNINSSGVKIYHVPGESGYEETRIDPSKGERWFCTADEAVTNGWRTVGG
jgi:micrococcal nuclease